MDVGVAQAGLLIDRDMVMVIGLHQTLVRRHGARPVSLKFLLDSQRSGAVDGHYDMEYELVDGAPLRVRCKPQGRSMLFEVSRGEGRMNYSVNMDRFVDEDLVPISTADYEDMVRHWLSD